MMRAPYELKWLAPWIGREISDRVTTLWPIRTSASDSCWRSLEPEVRRSPGNTKKVRLLRRPTKSLQQCRVVFCAQCSCR